MVSLKLKGKRVMKGYTQKALAEKMHMSEKTYNRKELGLIEFNRSEILSLVEILNLNVFEVDEIFFDNKLTKCIRDNDQDAALGHESA